MSENDMTATSGSTGSADRPSPAEASATFAITGMGCASCSAAIERALAASPGVSSATVDLAAATLSVRYDPAIIDDDGIIAVVRDVGFDGERLPGEGGASGA